ncbi:hypothetical protein TNCT_541191, partial [Trichonephila clavata]
RQAIVPTTTHSKQKSSRGMQQPDDRTSSCSASSLMTDLLHWFTGSFSNLTPQGQALADDWRHTRSIIPFSFFSPPLNFIGAIGLCSCQNQDTYWFLSKMISFCGGIRVRIFVYDRIKMG